MVVAYDGTEFYGWQKTKTGPSVEEALEKVLRQITQEPIELQAASRTDRGVHALGQVVNFFTGKEVNLISINRLLPPSIVVCSLEKMPPDFHPTLDVVSKEYRYEICYGTWQLPQFRRHSWFVPGELDVEKMREAARLLVGKHDFSAFCLNRKKVEYDDCVRTITQCHVEQMGEHRLQITIIGDSFFYKMVRCLVGSLVEAGKGRLDFESLLQKKNRVFAGATGPAHGLTLVRVAY